MELNLLNASGKASGTIKVSDEAFGSEYKESLVHQVVTAYMNGGRAGTKAQKTRRQVSGGGLKPWRQKGTGRARAGSSRSPLWRGGGKSFAAVPRSFEQKVNRKMYRAAMRSIMSELARQDRLVVVDSMELSAPKTKEMVAKMQALGVTDALFVVETVSENLALAARNLYHVGLCEAKDLDPVSLVGFEKVVVTSAAVKQIEERLA